MNSKVILSILLTYLLTTDCKTIEKQTFTYPNGNTRLEASYREDKPHGKFVTYYEDGTVKSVNQYKDGLQTGKSKEFYQNGNLKSVYYYQNDRRKGNFTNYYEVGKKRKKVEGEYDFIENHYSLDSSSLPLISVKINEWTYYSIIEGIDSIIRYKGLTDVYYTVDTAHQYQDVIVIDSILKVDYDRQKIK
jgi:hypothetical protein